MVNDRPIGEEDVEDGRLAGHLRREAVTASGVGQPLPQPGAYPVQALVRPRLAQFTESGEAGGSGDRGAVERSRLPHVLRRAPERGIEVTPDTRGPAHRTTPAAAGA